MSALGLVLCAIVLLGVSGVPSLFMPRSSAVGQRLGTSFMLLGGVLGIGGLWQSLHGPAAYLSAPWFLPIGEFTLRLDPLSAVFAALVFAVPALASVFGLSYWKQSEQPDNGRKVTFFTGMLSASMALVTLAGNGVLFLIVWEVMALCAYFVSTAKSDDPQVRRAGWIYLIATHTGTLLLFAFFALWKHYTGSFEIVATPLDQSAAGVLFIVAFVGFGFKAGIMPFHFWLPGSHAHAPSHISAILSGVMLKMGIYGILRTSSLFPLSSPWWGAGVIVLGALAGVAGIICALNQADIKKLLAYSSIENIGIIVMGIGLAILGRSQGEEALIFLGLGGALFHALNHGLFKSLLFMSSGVLIHAVNTRNMEQLGGLAARMPRTFALYLVGAIAICALPPLNGLAGEWVLYNGFLRTIQLPGAIAFAALGAVILAMIGTLVLAAFVKMTATVFLGNARSELRQPAHDPGPIMLVPMALAALGCVALGLLPAGLLKVLWPAVNAWAPLTQTTQIAQSAAPLGTISVVSVCCIGAVTLVFWGVRSINRGKRASAGTWDCGYAAPAARMQYSGSSFVRTLSELFSFSRSAPAQAANLKGLFVRKQATVRKTPSSLLTRFESLYAALGDRILPPLRKLQHGQTHFYIFYILIVTLLFFALFALGGAA